MSDNFFSGLSRGLEGGFGIAEQSRAGRLAAERTRQQAEMHRQDMELRRRQLDQAAKQNGFKNAMDVRNQFSSEIDNLTNAFAGLPSARRDQLEPGLRATIRKANQNMQKLNAQMGAQTFAPFDEEQIVAAARAQPSAEDEVTQAGNIASAEARARAAAQPNEFFLVPGTNFVVDRRTGVAQRLENVPQPLAAQVEIGSIPQGQQLVRDPDTGAIRLEAIPSPETEATAEREAAQELRQNETVTFFQNEVRRAVDAISPFSAGFVGNLTQGIGGTPAADLQNLLEPLRARISFDELRQLRESSTQGASGLGALNETEFRALQSVLGSLTLEQSPSQLEFNLKRASNLFTRLVDPRLQLPYPTLGFEAANRQSEDGSFNVEALAPAEIRALSDEDAANVDVRSLKTPAQRQAYQERLRGGN